MFRSARTSKKLRVKSAAPERRALLKIDGRTVEIILRTNPRARRYIVKVDPTTGVVSAIAPNSRSLSHALEFAKKERNWIADQLAEVPPHVELTLGAPILLYGVEHTVRRSDTSGGNIRRGSVWVDHDGARPTLRVSGRPEHAPRRVQDWLKREARIRIIDRATDYSDVLGVTPKHVTIRDTTSRWGSCSSTRNLSFSWRLVMAPPYVLDYVVAHEVAHLRELNHQPRFWRLLSSIVPDVDKPQDWLNEYGGMLHRYVPREKPLGYRT